MRNKNNHLEDLYEQALKDLDDCEKQNEKLKSECNAFYGKYHDLNDKYNKLQNDYKLLQDYAKHIQEYLCKDIFELMKKEKENEFYD